MKTKLLRIIRANFDIRYTEHFFFAYKKEPELHVPIHSSSSFGVIVKMLEQIYPQGGHYSIMRHSRRFKQARREESVRVIEIACIVGFVALIIIAILNSCCGSGIQY